MSSKNYGAKQYFYKIMIGCDQLVNAILAGSPEETLSSRIYRSDVLEPSHKLRWRIMHVVVNFIMRIFEKDHCQKAYGAEINKRYAPKGEWYD